MQRAKTFAVLGLVLCAAMASAHPVKGCDEDSISDVKADGEIIILLDGSVWKSLDPATSSTWLTADDVLICNDDKMVDTDEDGEEVDVVRVR